MQICKKGLARKLDSSHYLETINSFLQQGKPDDYNYYSGKTSY